jgi:hypothetical protein
MNIEDYLKAEFEAYPILFRDVATFIAKKEVLGSINVANEMVRCGCMDGQCALLTISQANGGPRYEFKCSKCLKSSGPAQKSPSLAYWQWVAKSDTEMFVGNPLVHTEKHASRLSKWRKVGVNGELEWLAAIKLTKKVWATHKKSDDYSLLSESDMLTVDCLSFLFAFLRKQALAPMAVAGLSIADDETGQRVDFLYGVAKADRLSMFDRYEKRLTNSFASVLRKELMSKSC